MPKYPNLQPLGKITITVGGNVLLSVNCGQQQGQTSTPSPGTPFVTGKPFRQMVIQADVGNTKNIYVLPRGKTLSANPDQIIIALAPGATVPLPYGLTNSSGYLPENFCFDTDQANNIAYGCGIMG